MSVGDGPVIRLVDEPATFHHAATAGNGLPGKVQPASGRFGLEEEPAVWPGFGGLASRAAAPLGISAPASAATLPNSATKTAADGLAGLSGIFAGAALLGLVWLLRRRAALRPRRPGI
jgi:hypothetical protein